MPFDSFNEWKARQIEGQIASPCRLNTDYTYKFDGSSVPTGVVNNYDFIKWKRAWDSTSINQSLTDLESPIEHEDNNEYVEFINTKNGGQFPASRIRNEISSGTYFYSKNAASNFENSIVTSEFVMKVPDLAPFEVESGFKTFMQFKTKYSNIGPATTNPMLSGTIRTDGRLNFKFAQNDAEGGKQSKAYRTTEAILPGHFYAISVESKISRGDQGYVNIDVDRVTLQNNEIVGDYVNILSVKETGLQTVPDIDMRNFEFRIGNYQKLDTNPSSTMRVYNWNFSMRK